jgi:hypothetical protein
MAASSSISCRSVGVEGRLPLGVLPFGDPSSPPCADPVGVAGGVDDDGDDVVAT